MELQLPPLAIPDRVSLTRPLKPFEKFSYAELDGPGCIRHIFVVLAHPKRMAMANRKCVIRIYFDDEPIPYVEAPVGDFFGVMHGVDWFLVDNHFLSVKAWNGYNCYFPMPFAQSARVEFEAGEEGNQVYLMVDWHRYPDQPLTESRRFCARWRREMPTQRYGEEFLMLDADGPGQLLGYAYGVRLIDDVDRWSHGGADNIYVDGDGEYPAYLRGIGGEDTFGAGYGGALHPPETHHYAAMPYYTHEDVGEARPAQRLVGYRFYEQDSIHFQKSLQLRFGCMTNDICSTVYWYQSQPVREFFKLPDWAQLLPGVELPRGTNDLALPTTGEWWLCGPFSNDEGWAMANVLPPETGFEANATYDGRHAAASAWSTEGSQQLGRDVARWVRRSSYHGFVDFNHVFRPWARGVGKTESGVAIARCTLEAAKDVTAHLRLAWDDHLVARVNDTEYDLGDHKAFRSQSIEVPLRKGANTITLKLSNTKGYNHGGWAFAFQALADGVALLPRL